MLLILLGDGMRYLMLRLRSPATLAAENLFLRKQLALYRERRVGLQDAVVVVGAAGVEAERRRGALVARPGDGT